MRAAARLAAGMTRTGARAGQAVALASVVAAAGRAHGVGPVRAVRRARWLRRRGFEYGEAWEMGLFDPAVPRDELAGYVSKYAIEGAQRRLNGTDDSPPSVSRKATFYLVCEAHGIRTPRLLGVIDRTTGAWFRPLVVARSPAEWERAIAEVLPDEWVVKPTEGRHGLGVRVVVRGENGLADGDGGPMDPAVLWRELHDDPEFEAFVVQERIHNHPVVAGLSASETLNTVRIVTVVEASGEVVPLWASLKLALSGGPVDNVRGGATGAAICQVGVEDGRLGAPFLRKPTLRGYMPVDALPDGTGTGGVRLPWWDDALELVSRGARAFLPLRTLGWDVAIAPEGPVIIEANTLWGAEPTPRMGAVLERLERMAPP
jgi:hypothetical protein